MKKLSLLIGDWCQQTLHLSESQYHIVAYGLELMIGGAFKILALLLAGAAFHCLPTVIAMMVVFGLLRSLAGGYHSSTHLGCLGGMFVVCFSPVLCAGLELRIAQILWIPMLIYSTYQFIKYAPRRSKVNPIYDARILKRKRIGSLVANFLVIALVIFFCNYSFCWILVNSLFAEAVLISAAVVDRK